MNETKDLNNETDKTDNTKKETENPPKNELVENFKNFVEILIKAKDFKPVIRLVLDTINDFGPEIEEIPKKISKWTVKNRIESVDMYQEAGFTKRDAILMTMDDAMAFRRITESFNKSFNKKK